MLWDICLSTSSNRISHDYVLNEFTPSDGLIFANAVKNCRNFWEILELLVNMLCFIVTDNRVVEDVIALMYNA